MAVRQALENDSWLDADEIQVSSEDGIVTLEGEVGDYLDLRYAWDDTWDTPGVRGVICRLDVRPASE
jgi:osmotically-inducible protein OsmY